MSYYTEEYSEQDYPDGQVVDQDFEEEVFDDGQVVDQETERVYDDRGPAYEDRVVERDDYVDRQEVDERQDFVERDEFVERDYQQPAFDNRQFAQRSVQDPGFGAARSLQPDYQDRGLDDRRYLQQDEFSSRGIPPPGPPPGAMQGPRKKSLMIGINYVGSQHALQGCHQDVTNMREFLDAMGYPADQRSLVIMRDDQRTDPRGPFWPNGHNMLAAMNWLVSEPNTVNFLHYSGHGGQVPSTGEYRASGFDDTIVPVDFERGGQIPSGVLHRTLVTTLPPNSTLFVLLDCCHSGSAIELPYVYRSDEDGNVSLLDNVQAGMRLVGEASHLIQGGFTIDKVGEAKQLLAGATSFFKGLTHQPDELTDQFGLGEQEFAGQYRAEGMRNVWMYSGCRDDQTSADADIQGSHVGAMSWAFLECIKRFGPRQSYLQVLQNTRQILAGRYSQVPQLSVGYEQDLNYPIRI